jgi:Protein of unknown function (DUF3180)
VTPTRVWSLVALGAVCAVASWLGLRVAYSSLPPLPWTGVPALLLLAIAESWSGRNLRARLRGRVGSKPIVPIAVARMAALAKASSLAGALVGGLTAGFLIYVLGSLDKSTPRSDAFAAGCTLASAVLLVLAALYLERGCLARPLDQDDDGRPA